MIVRDTTALARYLDAGVTSEIAGVSQKQTSNKHDETTMSS
jgi:hypothetical protein